MNAAVVPGNQSAIVLQVYCLSAALIMHAFFGLLHGHPLQYHYQGTLQIHCTRLRVPPCDLHISVGLSKHGHPFTPHSPAPCPCLFCHFWCSCPRNGRRR